MVTEIIELKVKEGISQEIFLDIVDKVECEFHMKQRGFIDTELAKGDGNKWVMIQHYKTMEDIKLVGEKIPDNIIMKEFSELVVEGSVKIIFLERIKVWQM